MRHRLIGIPLEQRSVSHLCRTAAARVACKNSTGQPSVCGKVEKRKSFSVAPLALARSSPAPRRCRRLCFCLNIENINSQCVSVQFCYKFSYTVAPLFALALVLPTRVLLHSCQHDARTPFTIHPPHAPSIWSSKHFSHRAHSASCLQSGCGICLCILSLYIPTSSIYIYIYIDMHISVESHQLCGQHSRAIEHSS